MVLVTLIARIALAQGSSGNPAVVKASSAARYVVPRTPWGDSDI